MANKPSSPRLGKTLKVPYFDEAYTKLVESFKWLTQQETIKSYKF